MHLVATDSALVVSKPIWFVSGSNGFLTTEQSKIFAITVVWEGLLSGARTNVMPSAEPAFDCGYGELLMVTMQAQAGCITPVQPCVAAALVQRMNWMGWVRIPASSNNGGLICTGAVTAYKGYLSLTSEPFPGSPDPPLDKVGRVLYHHPVLAWPASITTIFTIRISKYSNSTDDSGENTQQLAVELDTCENDFDLDGNRVGINTTSASEPVAAKSLCTSGVELKSGRKLTVIIRYNGSKKSLYVYVHYVGNPSKKILKQHIDISNIVPSSICRIHC
ncbi:hypothetical protein WN943_000319 [Citrus x changshan-huyou]|uniref:Uncharacterized protein n=1 Tax=Citrus sinensis TaxID=2711 RepID=A0ACB8NLW8_CITSI|nr:hypothetical protein KPL71_000246 [Citrus sinensis]